jgi:hypothetical protein
MVVEENTLRMTVPDGRAFRLGACATFVTIPGDTLHEMDVAWQNEDDGRLWLVELKDYGELVSEDPNFSYLVENLADKVRDTLYVLASVWAGSAFGNDLRRDIEATFPDFPSEPCPMRPVAVLNLEAGQVGPLMTKLNTELNDEMQSVLAVMDIERLLVVTPDHPFVTDQLRVEIEAS